MQMAMLFSCRCKINEQSPKTRHTWIINKIGMFFFFSAFACSTIRTTFGAAMAAEKKKETWNSILCVVFLVRAFVGRVSMAKIRSHPYFSKKRKKQPKNDSHTHTHTSEPSISLCWLLTCRVSRVVRETNQKLALESNREHEFDTWTCTVTVAWCNRIETTANHQNIRHTKKIYGRKTIQRREKLKSPFATFDIWILIHPHGTSLVHECWTSGIAHRRILTNSPHAHTQHTNGRVDEDKWARVCARIAVNCLPVRWRRNKSQSFFHSQNTSHSSVRSPSTRIVRFASIPCQLSANAKANYEKIPNSLWSSTSHVKCQPNRMGNEPCEPSKFVRARASANRHKFCAKWGIRSLKFTRTIRGIIEKDEHNYNNNKKILKETMVHC